MSKVRRDKHSIFVKTGGYIFRPIGPSDSPETSIYAGETVKANHIGGSIYGRIKNESTSELWYSHGCYLDDNCKHIQSTEIFKTPNTFDHFQLLGLMRQPT